MSLNCLGRGLTFSLLVNRCSFLQNSRHNLHFSWLLQFSKSSVIRSCKKYEPNHGCLPIILTTTHVPWSLLTKQQVLKLGSVIIYAKTPRDSEAVYTFLQINILSYSVLEGWYRLSQCSGEEEGQLLQFSSWGSLNSSPGGVDHRTSTELWCSEHP